MQSQVHPPFRLVDDVLFSSLFNEYFRLGTLHSQVYLPVPVVDFVDFAHAPFAKETLDFIEVEDEITFMPLFIIWLLNDADTSFCYFVICTARIISSSTIFTRRSNSKRAV